MGEKSLGEHVAEFVGGAGARLALANHLGQVLAALAEKSGIGEEFRRIQVRPKGLFSFAEKARRRDRSDPKKPRYSAPVRQNTDLVGARLVVPTCIEADAAIAKLLEWERRDLILIDHCNSFRREQRLEKDRFGYRATHFVVALNVLDVDGAVAPSDAPWLRDGRAARRDSADVHQHGHTTFEYPVELQIRTELEDLFGKESHDRLYKREGTAPPELERMAAQLAAALEMADGLMVQIRRRMDAIRSTQLAQRSADSIRRELDDLASIRSFIDRIQPESRRQKETRMFDARQAQLHAALGEWEKVKELLAGYADPDRLTAATASLSRDLARAWVNGSAEEAPHPEAVAALLTKVVNATPCDEEALCDLGDLRISLNDLSRAYDAFRRAYEANPLCVRARRSLLTTRIVQSKELGHLDLHDPQLAEAIRIGVDQARGGLNCPTVYFDLALLQWARCEARLQREQPPHSEADGRAYRELEARWFTPALDYACRGIADAHAATYVQVAERRVRELLGSLKIGEASQKRLELLADLMALGSRVIQLHKGAGKPSPHGCVRVLAGVTDPNGDTYSALRLEERFAPIFRRFVREWKGLLIAPGTGFGIDKPLAMAALDLNPTHKFRGESVAGADRASLRVWCYAPKDVKLADPRLEGLYNRRATGEPDFRPGIAVRYWRELLDAGHTPADVRLLGVDGGWISRFEYMLCAALGGKAALVFFDHPNDWPHEEEPGSPARLEDTKDRLRAVYATLRNDYWGTHKNILPLPFDHAAVALWLEDPLPKRDFKAFDSFIAGEVGKDGMPLPQPEHYDEMVKEDRAAKLIHAAYIPIKQQTLGGKGDDSTLPWDHLQQGYRDSNREAVAAWDKKLELAEFLRGATASLNEYGGTEEFFKERPDKKPMEGSELDPDLIRWLSVAEHARWMVENLLSGTRFGERKNEPRKTRPTLVSWWHLSEADKRLDWAQSFALWEHFKGGKSDVAKSS